MMHGSDLNSEGNRLLSALSPACLKFLNDQSLTKPIVSGEVLYEPDSPLQNFVFPLDGLVSLQCLMEDHRTAEMISVGMDGALGVEHLLGQDRLSGRAVTVISGHASWLPIHALVEALDSYPCLRPALQLHVDMRMKQLMRAVACASIHCAGQRLATWLLHAQDRTQIDIFEITQQVLADILGVRLATVSESCSKLLALGAIRYKRGVLEIVDRAHLEEQACECYAAVRVERFQPHVH